MIEVINYQTFTDEFGKDGNATVSVVDRDRGLYACHSSFSRGGCLNLGTVTLRNLRAEIGGSREFEITSRASDSAAHIAYLISLAEKHVGSAS